MVMKVVMVKSSDGGNVGKLAAVEGVMATWRDGMGPPLSGGDGDGW